MTITKKNKTYKRKTYKRKGSSSIAALTKKVNSLALLSRPEFKVNEVVRTSLGNTDGFIGLLNGMTRGTDFTQMIGREATYRSLQWHIRILKASAVGTNYGWYSIVVDKQANESTPDMDDIWTTAQGQFRNLDNRKRFAILKTRQFTLDADDPEFNFKGYMKLNLKTVYDITNNGTVFDIKTNALYLVCWSNQPTTDGYSFQFNGRLRFTDV